MADVTARLLWYRIQESSALFHSLWSALLFLAEAGGPVLNCIFLAWIIIALVTVLFVTYNTYQSERLQPKEVKFVKDNWAAINRSPLTKKRIRDASTMTVEVNSQAMFANQISDLLMGTPRQHEGFDMLSVLLHWIIYGQSAMFWKASLLERLLTSLTKISENIGGDEISIRFASIESDVDPRVIIREQGYSDKGALAMNVQVILSDLKLSVTMSDYVSALVHSNALLSIKSLDMNLDVTLSGSGYHMTHDYVVTDINQSVMTYFPYYPEMEIIANDQRIISHFTDILNRLHISFTVSLQPMVEITIAEPPIIMSTAFEASTCPPKPPRLIEDKRLMLKLIKATRVAQKGRGPINAFCSVEVDSPKQKQTTSVVKNTVNPYWDEHFLFDLGTDTTKLMFRMYCESNVNSDECVGVTDVDLDYLRANPGVRIVLALTGEDDTETFGSVTLEAYFVDSAEFDRVNEDDVFSQAVEPLCIPVEDHDRPSSHSSAIYSNSLNDDFANSYSAAADEWFEKEFEQQKKAEEEGTNMQPSPVTEERIGNEMLTSRPVMRRSHDNLMTQSDSFNPKAYSYDHKTLPVTLSATSPDEGGGERKSRFSSLKKRFTRTKDKKPRSHSLDRVHDKSFKSGSPDQMGNQPANSKKFGGSLRKLFHRRNKSPSVNLLNDLDKPLRRPYESP